MYSDVVFSDVQYSDVVFSDAQYSDVQYSDVLYSAVSGSSSLQSQPAACSLQHSPNGLHCAGAQLTATCAGDVTASAELLQGF